MVSEALITGASRGLGAAVAGAYGAEGAHVVLCARSAENLESTAEAIRAAGGTATVAPADVRDEEALFDALAAACEDRDPLDALVPAAGISSAPPGERPLTEEWYEDFDDTLATNARGLFATLREALPFAAGDARVLVPSGEVAREPTEGMGAYAVSKAAAEGVARGFAADAEQAVGLLYPGLLATALTGGKGRDPESVAEMFVWAAGLPAEELNGEVLGLRDWKRATR